MCLIGTAHAEEMLASANLKFLERVKTGVRKIRLCNGFSVMLSDNFNYAFNESFAKLLVAIMLLCN